MMMMDGIPVIYQGQEQRYSGANDPYNREPVWKSGYSTQSELYEWIAKLNRFRNFAIDTDDTYVSSRASVILNSTHIIVMKKGNAITIATNVGLGASKSNVTLTQKMTGFYPSTTYMDVLRCEAYETTKNGSLNIELGSEAKILYPAVALESAGFECENIGKCIPLFHNYMDENLESSNTVAEKTSKCLVKFSIEAQTSYGEMVMMWVPQGRLHQLNILGYYTDFNQLILADPGIFHNLVRGTMCQLLHLMHLHILHGPRS